MGTTAEKLAKLSQTKNNIKEAIEAKGVTIPADSTFASYPDYIAQITGGVVPTGNIEISQQEGTNVKNYATASVKSGVASINSLVITQPPTITVANDTGVVSSTYSESKAITADVVAGWVDSIEDATVSISGSSTYQLSVQAETSYLPTGAETTIIPQGKFTTGEQKIAAEENFVAENIRSTVSMWGVQGSLVVNKFYIGTDDPDSSLGNDGDIYIKY